MNTPWSLIIAIVSLAGLYVLLPRVGHTFARYRATRALTCPETGSRARVDLDASHAAFTSAFGEPHLRARWCTLWPGRRGCREGCLDRPDVERP